MTKEIEKLELAIWSDVFRYRRVVDLKLPICLERQFQLYLYDEMNTRNSRI